MRPLTPFDPSRLAHLPAAEAALIAALAKLQEQQKPRHRNNIGFALLLGVSEGLWRHTKAGRKPLGWKLLVAGSDVLPERLVVAARRSLELRTKARGRAA